MNPYNESNPELTLSQQLAATAANIATDGVISKAPSVIKEIAKLSVQLNNPELQKISAEATMECLSVIEKKSHACFELLLKPLMNPHSTPQLLLDSVWILVKMTQHCELSRKWLLAANGLTNIFNVLRTNSSHKDIVSCSVGLVYNLKGLGGLCSLLNYSIHGLDGMGQQVHLPDCVLSPILWAVQDNLVKEECEAALGSDILRMLVHLLKICSSHDLDVQHACCSCLEILVHSDGILGALFMQLQGCPALLGVMRTTMRLPSNAGGHIACSCLNIMVMLTDSRSEFAEVFRGHNAMDLLGELCLKETEAYSQSSDGSRRAPTEEAAVWALGHLAGLGGVLRLMTMHQEVPAVIRGGLSSISELAASATEPADLHLLAELLGNLWNLLDRISQPNPPIKCRKKCVAAICAIMVALSPHATPGVLGQLDQAVEGLLNFQQMDLLADVDVEIAENTVETLGRLALTSSAWRDYLRMKNTSQVLESRISTGLGHRKLLKYTFWAAAAISGLPFVCTALEANLKAPCTVDAAFCTIIDILDDDLEGEWVLSTAARGQESAIPGVLALIADAMRGCAKDAVLQSRGCHCIGLLVPLSPAGAVPSSTVAAIFNAVRWHTHAPSVVRDALFAFHALLAPGAGANSSQPANPDVQRSLVQSLQEQGAEKVAARALVDFQDGHTPELLEEAVVVLCSLSGITEALRVLVEAGPGPVRLHGLKAVAEFGRHQPQLLRQNGQQVMQAIAHMASASPEDEGLHQHMELLAGFCKC